MIASWIKNLRLRPADQRYALLEACLIGVISALAALTLKQGIGWLGGYRVYGAYEYGWFILPLTGFFFGGLTGLLLQWVSPEATGGGIPQVKMVLAQLPVSLSIRSALVKMLGTIFVLGAGFTLGRRGPTVYIGAALAAQLSVWFPTSPQHRRQMIAAGAAAGLAAGFNTPIAGIVFVVEELMRDISGFTLETAILASFTGAVVSRLLAPSEIMLPSLVSEKGWEVSFVPEEIPFFLLLGISTGLLGILFNRGILLSLNFYQNLKWFLPLKIAIAGLISGSIVAMLPDFFRDNAGLRDFLITGEGGWQITAIALVAYFFLTLIAYGSGIPGGLFSPALVLGSALGYLIGVAEVSLFGFGTENTYALAGMGAMFTAVVRVPVTAIIIIFELTANFELVLPLMISCATAYVVGEALSSGSLYQQLLAAKGIHLKEESNVDPILAQITAKSVMSFPVETLSADLTLDEACQIFSRSKHHGFPIVEQGKLVGLMSENDLEQYMGRRISRESTLKEMMISRPVTVSPLAPLQEVLYLLNRYQLSHLPVTKNQRLLGIITRSDIIRAELEALNNNGNGKTSALEQRLVSEPSYVIYQTRSPAVGKGRILLPLANPDSVVILTAITRSFAKFRQGELELLNLIKVSRKIPPHQVWVNPMPGRELLQKAEALVQQEDIPVHTQLRTTHNLSEAILEVIEERKISLLVMGWKGTKNVITGRLFGNLAEKIVRRAPCDVVFIKPKAEAKLTDLSASQRWLIPIAFQEGKADKLLALLPQLSAFAHAPEFILCIVDQSQPLPEITSKWSKKLQVPVQSIPISAQSRENGVLQLAREQECDVIVLVTTLKRASRSLTLEPTFENNLPAMIAKRFQGTVILVRPA
ncbi:MAG: chloride channel protein [Halothece sp.]